MAIRDSSGKKIGRNDTCPCGSQLKFKYCCGKVSEKGLHTVAPGPSPALRKKVAQINKKRKEFEHKHGRGRPIITTEFKDWRIVAVGDEIHYRKKEKAKFFTDFLGDYVRTKFGTEWGNSEIAKPYEERHQILKWYNSMCSFQMKQTPEKAGTYCTSPNGAMLSWFRLGYDLYLIKHNAKLQEEILNRLRNKQQFQGARFELCAAATMIVAGFQVDFEDEKDRTRKHAEFIATYPDGLKIAVEAKSRHRNCVLDFNSQINSNEAEQQPKVVVERLIRKALAKEPDCPYIIFIDVNLPHSETGYENNPWFKEIVKTVEKLVEERFPENFPANAIFFCNDPTYQDPEKVTNGFNFWCYEFPIDNPKYPLPDKKMIRHISYAAIRRTTIPNRYPENYA